MAKRTALNYNTNELTATLRQSSGKGVDALFSPPSPTPAPEAKEDPESAPASSLPEKEQEPPPATLAAVQDQNSAQQKELESNEERILTSKNVRKSEKQAANLQASEDWDRGDPESAPSAPLSEKEQEPPPATPAAVQAQSLAEQKKLESRQERNLTSKHVSMPESENWEREDHILDTLAEPAQINHSFRYSREELTFIRDVVYEMEVKYKTKLGRGEVLRIALLWLKHDYRTKGQESLLFRLLTRKKARR